MAAVPQEAHHSSPHAGGPRFTRGRTWIRRMNARRRPRPAWAIAGSVVIASLLFVTFWLTALRRTRSVPAGPEGEPPASSAPVHNEPALRDTTGAKEKAETPDGERIPWRAAATEPDAQLASLDLTVLDSLGQPVAGAEVRLIGGESAQPGDSLHGRPDHAEFHTDGEGRLTVRDLRPSVSAMEVIAAGRGWARQALSLSAGDESQLLVTLLPFCSVWGKVYADGEEVPGALVRLVGAMDTAKEVSTDESGLFELFDIPGDRANLLGTHTVHGATELEIALSPGSIRRQDVHMGACSCIHGRILGDDGNPVSMWQILAIASEGTGSRQEALSDEDGLWRIVGLRSGKYDLEARRPYWTSELPEAVLEGVDSCAPEEHVVRVSTPPAQGFFEGQVVFGHLDPARRVDVCARRTDKMELHCMEPMASAPNFRIGPLAPGEYVFLVRVDQKVVLCTAQTSRLANDQVVDVGRIVVPPLASIRVRTIPGSTSPTARKVTVSAEPIDGWQGSQDLRGRYANGTLGESVVLELLAPGRYRLGGSGENVAEVQRILTITGPGEYGEDLVLEDGCFIPVSVRARGVPSGGALVELMVVKEPGSEKWLERSFSVENSEAVWSGVSVAEGAYRIQIAHAGEVLAEATVEVRRDELGRLTSTPLEAFAPDLGQAGDGH